MFAVMLTVFIHAAGFTIKGIVQDDAGNPLITQILLKENRKNFLSGADGRFSIPFEGKKATLVFTAVGFETKEITVTDAAPVTVKLKAIVALLDEVVVTGYGTQLKKDITGSVAADAIMAMAKPVLQQSLQGSVAGVVMNGRFRTPAKEYREGTRKDRLLHEPWNREGYDAITENPFRDVAGNPLSTFSIDVDAASYSNIRRMLRSGHLPQRDAVRIEEMINYFPYEYEAPKNDQPFTMHTEQAVCPWEPKHQLVLIGMQAKKIEVSQLPPANLVFLVDVSGSMFSPDKLPLVQASLKMLTDQLRPQDKVSLVAYAGNAGLVLPSTSGENKTLIKEAIDRLEAGGSTAGGAGIQLAYQVALDNYVKEGNNRVILCTDGDFNVGVSSDAALEQLIEEKRKSNVFLTVLGFGTGNYQDAKMQKLADKGNGNHAYIDQLGEAKKVLVNEFGGTLFTIAKDVKLQVEFNPSHVAGWRLIGYENRILAKEDFADDTKDAGELGSGHTVTALYEIVPKGIQLPDAVFTDSLRYQVPSNKMQVTSYHPKFSEELMNIKVRYKAPDGEKSSLLNFPVKGKAVSIYDCSMNFRFAASVASFGMLLRGSKYKGDAAYQTVTQLAGSAIGKDAGGYRSEFLSLVDLAAGIGGKESSMIHYDK